MPEDAFVSVPSFPTAQRRRWVPTVLFILVLLGVLIFAWRVLSFYQRIQNGTIDPGTYGITRPSTDAALRAFAAQASGSGVLATGDDPQLGSDAAAVTVVEFADFGCPYSRAESFVVRALAQQFPDDVRIIYRDFPLEDLHPGAEVAAQVGTCAAAQGKFWEYHDAIFDAQGDITAENIAVIAEEIGLNKAALASCLHDAGTKAEMEQDLGDGYNAGVQGTPTFFVNGEKIEGAIPFDLFVKIIAAFADQARQPS